VERTDRADAIAVRSILAHTRRCAAVPVGPARHGLAIVIGSLGAGGAQRQVVELVRQIGKLPREVVGPVFLLLISRSSRGPEFYAARLAGLDMTIEFMSDFQLDAQQVVPPEIAAQLGVLSPNSRDTTIYLADRLRAHRPAAVLSMSDLLGIPAALAAAIVGVPRIVVSARNEPPPLRRQTEGLLKPGYQALLGQEWISLVTNCAGTAKDFADWLEIPAARVGVVYNGVDIDGLIAQREEAQIASHRRALGIPASARIVGSIFQARRQKRPRLWFRAAAAIARRAPDVAFVLIGDRLQGDDITAILAEYGLQDRFHRPGLQSDVANWLELMDVVLLTSETEGTPNVLLEAQSLGRPVVATAVGGCAESFIPDQTGVLVSADPSPEEVADAVLRVLDDPAFAARAAAEGPAFIRRRFNPQRMASEYVDLCFSPYPESMKLAVSA
jgi:glycosyltransferase involved in cell wall biosynthesis